MKKKKLETAIRKSPINYFSDLFVAAMVVAWIVVLAIMIAVAWYATLKLEDTSIWAYVWELTGIPLTAGGAIWMIKNTVQHSIANQSGKEVPYDFPAVNDNLEIDEQEKAMFAKYSDILPSKDDSEAVG